jgi:hypothetical protein
LRDLTLTDTEQWADLSFLRPVRHTLRTLKLRDCDHTDDAASLLDLVDDETMPQLTSLTLLDSYDLDAVALRALRPPSALLPSLQQFVYDRVDEY